MPLNKNMPVKAWIDDFIKSDAPQFEGKSRKERIKMALGAYYSAQKESVELDEQAKWRQQTNRPTGPGLGKTFVKTTVDYGDREIKEPIGKDGLDDNSEPIEKRDPLEARNNAKKSQRGKDLLPKNAQRNLKGLIKMAKGTHGKSNLPEEVELDEAFDPHKTKHPNGGTVMTLVNPWKKDDQGRPELITHFAPNRNPGKIRKGRMKGYDVAFTHDETEAEKNKHEYAKKWGYNALSKIGEEVELDEGKLPTDLAVNAYEMGKLHKRLKYDYKKMSRPHPFEGHSQRLKDAYDKGMKGNSLAESFKYEQFKYEQKPSKRTGHTVVGATFVNGLKGANILKHKDGGYFASGGSSTVQHTAIHDTPEAAAKAYHMKESAELDEVTINELIEQFTEWCTDDLLENRELDDVVDFIKTHKKQYHIGQSYIPATIIANPKLNYIRLSFGHKALPLVAQSSSSYTLKTDRGNATYPFGQYKGAILDTILFSSHTELDHFRSIMHMKFTDVVESLLSESVELDEDHGLKTINGGQIVGAWEHNPPKGYTGNKVSDRYLVKHADHYAIHADTDQLQQLHSGTLAQMMNKLKMTHKPKLPGVQKEDVELTEEFKKGDLVTTVHGMNGIIKGTRQTSKGTTVYDVHPHGDHKGKWGGNYVGWHNPADLTLREDVDLDESYDVKYLGKYEKDGKKHTLWHKGNYQYELTLSSQEGKGFKHITDWTGKSHEDVHADLTSKGYKKLREDVDLDEAAKQYHPEKAPYGMRHSVFAGKEQRLKTVETWHKSPAAREKYANKIADSDGFHEFLGYHDPGNLKEGLESEHFDELKRHQQKGFKIRGSVNEVPHGSLSTEMKHDDGRSITVTTKRKDASGWEHVVESENIFIRNMIDLGNGYTLAELTISNIHEVWKGDQCVGRFDNRELAEQYVTEVLDSSYLKKSFIAQVGKFIADASKPHGKKIKHSDTARRLFAKLNVGNHMAKIAEEHNLTESKMAEIDDTVNTMFDQHVQRHGAEFVGAHLHGILRKIAGHVSKKNNMPLDAAHDLIKRKFEQ